MDTALQTRFSQAVIAFQQGSWQQAERTLLEITQSWPDCKEAWYQLGELYQQQGQWQSAIEMYSRVLELDPEIQEVYFNLGVLASQNQELEMAKSYWQQALQINPAYYQVHLMLVLLLLRLQQHPQAISQLSGLLAQDPQSTGFVFFQARELLERGQYLECSVFCQALRQSERLEKLFVILIEIQALHELGLNLEAQQIIKELPQPWQGFLQSLYVPADYPSSEALETAQAQLDQLLMRPANLSLSPEILQQLPRLRGWELLNRRAQVDAWLVSAAQLPPVKPLKVSGQRQKLVCVLDLASLPWQGLFWRYLAALPARSWEVHIRLPQEAAQLLLNPPALRSLASISALPAGLEQAAQELQDLEAGLILYSAPAQDNLQFWLSRLRLAPLQLAWVINGSQLGFDAGSQLDGLAPHWFQPGLPALKTPGEALLYAMPGQGWSPADLSRLLLLGRHTPLLLIGTIYDLRRLEALHRELGQAQLLQVELGIWQNWQDLAALFARASCFLTASGAELYTQAAASCGLHRFSFEQSLSAQELQQALAEVQALELEGPDPLWLQRDQELPATRWAVSLQDQLSKSLRSQL